MPETRAELALSCIPAPLVGEALGEVEADVPAGELVLEPEPEVEVGIGVGEAVGG